MFLWKETTYVKKDTLEIIVNINNITKIMLKTTNVNNFSLILLGFFPLTITVVLLFIVRLL